MTNRFKLFFVICVALILFSCERKVLFNQYVPLNKSKWAADNVIAIEIPVKDTVSFYNLFINIRNTKDYAFSNIYLITRISFPDNKQVIDTLEYEMADAKGRFLGSGFSDLKENKLFYKEKIRFNKPGYYLFELKQAMRKRDEIVGVDPLEGISDVGISVEKIN